MAMRLLIWLREVQLCQPFESDSEDTRCWSAAYIVEVLSGSHDEGRLLVLVVLHPALSEEFPVCGSRRTVVTCRVKPPQGRDLLPLTRME